MDLKIQLLSILFSFGFGILSSYLYNFCYSFIYKTSLLYKIVINLLFCINLGLIYFLLLKIINNGIVHIYFILSFILGFGLFVNKYNFIRKNLNVKKYK